MPYVRQLSRSLSEEITRKSSLLSRRSLAGKTIFITGASRGIGKQIALRCAKDKANIVVAAKTTEPHPKLPGTIYTAAEESNDALVRSVAQTFDVVPRRSSSRKGRRQVSALRGRCAR